MDGLVYEITVDDAPARRGTERVNKALDSVSESAKKNAREASTALVALSASTTTAAGAIR